MKDNGQLFSKILYNVKTGNGISKMYFVKHQSLYFPSLNLEDPNDV